MNAESDDARRSEPRARSAAKGSGETAARGTARKPIAPRGSRYMIAPVGPALSVEEMVKRLQDLGGQDLGGIEIVRTLAPPGTACPPIAAVRMPPERATSLRQSAADMLVIENDEPLLAASTAVWPSADAPSLRVALGPGFTTTIHVLNESSEPVEDAEVQLIGQSFTAQGLTGADGKVTLTLYGEIPESVTDLLVKPRNHYWGLWRARPQLQPEATNTVHLRVLSAIKGIGWGGQAMRFDRLPGDYRGAGVKIALIDSGVATSHKQLGQINRGFDASDGDAGAWSQDPTGHGTACAGIISAAAAGIRGYARDAELHVCWLAAESCSSDLIAAIDYCVAAGIDIACLGFGAQRLARPSAKLAIAASENRSGVEGCFIIWACQVPNGLAAGLDHTPFRLPDIRPHWLCNKAIRPSKRRGSQFQVRPSWSSCVCRTASRERRSVAAFSPTPMTSHVCSTISTGPATIDAPNGRSPAWYCCWPCAAGSSAARTARAGR
jgi:subtilisin